MRRVAIIGAALAFVGCSSVIGEDFEGYSEAEQTVVFGCDPVAPFTSSQRFYSCDSGETCLFASPGGTVDMTRGWADCIETTGYKPIGASCSYANECGPGAWCSTTWGCSAFCHVGSSCADGSACLAFEPEVKANGLEIGFCAPPSCEPVASGCQGTCAFYESDRTACLFDTGTGELGASCKSDTDCKEHLGCNDVAKHCTHYCRVDGDDCKGKACIATDNPPLFYAGERYGYCAL